MFPLLAAALAFAPSARAGGLSAGPAFEAGLAAARESALRSVRRAPKPAPGDPALAAARRLAAALGEPAGLAELFDGAFRRAAGGPEGISRVLGELGSLGPVRGLRPLGRDSALDGRYVLVFESGAAVRLRLRVSGAEPGKIAGLVFGRPTRDLRSFDDVLAAFSELPGTVSFKLQRLGGRPATLAELHPDEALGIGSAMKLYILAAVAEEGAWDRVLRLRGELKSWPSGDMQTWPDGAPVTVHTLAVKMISQSDNTATDHLLDHVGRERAEDMLAELGNEHAGRDVPFLSTQELFKLLSDAGLRESWQAADAAGRRALLAGAVRELPRERVSAEEIAFPEVPVLPGLLDWFASAADLCRAMAWFDARNEPTALAVLAVNPMLDFPRSAFSYAGYKGGSIPGALNMTFLIRGSSGESYALSAGWNDPASQVDMERFLPLVQAAVDLLSLGSPGS